MPQEKSILFLYTRLPDYFYRCIQHFVHAYSFHAVIIRYREDANTNYTFAPDDRIRLLYKNENDVSAVIAACNPEVIILSSWKDKIYVNASRKAVKKIPVVLGLDNPWTGSLKQQIFVASAPYYLRKFCSHIWAAGWSQYDYARRLGFDKSKIYSGIYSADTSKFYRFNEPSAEVKKTDFPRTLVYLGRLVEYKQPHILAKVFNDLVANNNLNWKLILVGEGPLKEIIKSRRYAHVEIRNFVSPADLPSFYTQVGIFCLPSMGEHWGVAVHEAAAAGLPLLLSDSVESASQFLIHGYNGFSFKSGNEQSLKDALLNLLSLSDEALTDMGARSIVLSKRIGPDHWAATLNSILLQSK